MVVLLHSFIARTGRLASATATDAGAQILYAGRSWQLYLKFLCGFQPFPLIVKFGCRSYHLDAIAIF